MDKVKKFAKKHKKALIKWGSIGIVILIVFIFLYNLLMPNTGVPVYGNRLDDIDKVSISNGRKQEVVSNTTGVAGVEEVSVDVKGKLINTIVKVNTDFPSERAGEIVKAILDTFIDSEKAYYDFQFFVTKDGASSPFPMIGYKNKKRADVVWGINKQVTE